MNRIRYLCPAQQTAMGNTYASAKSCKTVCPIEGHTVLPSKRLQAYVSSISKTTQHTPNGKAASTQSKNNSVGVANRQTYSCQWLCYIKVSCSLSQRLDFASSRSMCLLKQHNFFVIVYSSSMTILKSVYEIRNHNKKVSTHFRKSQKSRDSLR